MPKCVVKRDAKGRFAGCMPGTGGGSSGGSGSRSKKSGGGGLASQKVDDLQAIAKKEGIELDTLSYKSRRSVLVKAIEAKRAGKDLREEGLLKPTKAKKTKPPLVTKVVEVKPKIAKPKIAKGDHEAIARLGSDFVAKNTTKIDQLQKEYDSLNGRAGVLARKLTNPATSQQSRIKAGRDALALDKRRQEIDQQLNQEFINLRNKIGEATPLNKLEARKLAEKANIAIADPALKFTTQGHLADFYYLTGGQGSSKDGIGKIEAKADRAYTHVDGSTRGYVDVGKNADRRSAWHEFGHHAEAENPDILAANQRFRFSRRESPAPEKLSDITGNKGYGDEEIAVRGNFISPYVGKIYPPSVPATEVHSMGIEAFSTPRDMRDFYAKDRGHFDLILGHMLNR